MILPTFHYNPNKNTTSIAIYDSNYESESVLQIGLVEENTELNNDELKEINQTTFNIFCDLLTLFISQHNLGSEKGYQFGYEDGYNDAYEELQEE